MLLGAEFGPHGKSKLGNGGDCAAVLGRDDWLGYVMIEGI